LVSEIRLVVTLIISESLKQTFQPRMIPIRECGTSSFTTQCLAVLAIYFVSLIRYGLKISSDELGT